MAKEKRHARSPVGTSRRRQPASGRAYSRRHGTGSDIECRLELYTEEPASIIAWGPEFVYIMRDAGGLHKIGSSNNPALRRRTVHGDVGRSRRPVRLVRVIQVQSGTARGIEANAHRLLAPFRRDGEWFEASMRRCNWAVEASLWD